MYLLGKVRLILLCLGLGLSLWRGDSFAQNLITIQNQINVNYKDTINRNYSTESNIVITPVASLIDLWGIKEGPADAIPGGIATYTITYGNKGTITAYNVQIVDRFPQEMEAIVYQNSGYSLNLDPITKLGTWNVDILPPGTYSFKISIRIKMDAIGTITNSLKIESKTPELYDNNYSTATTQIKFLNIDLWVIKTAPTSILTGGISTYTITYGNSGNVPATNVRLSDQFPQEMKAFIYGTSGLVFDTATKRGTWNLGNVIPGTYSFNLAISIKDNVRGSTTVTNTMKIECLDVETNYTNNQATASTHIIDTDMEIFKYGNSGVISGQELTYSIYYRNRGNTPAENVTIIDYFPPGVRYATDTSGVIPTVTGSGTVSSPQVVIWNLGGSTNWWQSFNITAFVTEELPASPSLSSQINNVVVVTTATPEINYSNNRATLTTTVESARADISIYKYVTSPAISGHEITYKISYHNYGGNIDAGSIAITDYLPQGLKYISNTEIGSPTITGSVTSGGQILTWQIGTMTRYECKQFSIRALITLSGSNTINNVVKITTETKEKSYANNQATATVHIEEPKIDLWIYKYGPSKINPGYNTIEYSIRYGNYGNIEVGSVTIVDTLPSPATGTIIYGTDTSGLPRTETGNQISWFVGTVIPGEFKYFSLTLVATKDQHGNYIPGSTTLTNTINITGAETEGNMTNNSNSCNTHVIPPEIDLEISKRGPYQILAGEDIVYTIQYRNRGSVDAGSTTITDTLPVGVTYATDTSGLAPRIISAGTQTQVIWEFGTRAMTGSRNWVIFQLKGTVKADLPASTTLANRIEIANAEDINSSNNACTWRTHIILPKADLRITKYKVSPYEVTPGCELTYCIAYDNYYGNVHATNTVITDTLPGSVTFVSCTGNGTLTTDGKVKWELGTVSNTYPGCDGYLYLIVRVNAEGSKTLVNTVKITSDTTDLDYSNNQATDTTHVVDWYADVQVTKSGQYNIQPGQTLRYMIGYGNYNGNIPATNTIITDTLPSGVYYATDTSGLIVTGTSTLIWNVGTLSPRSYYYFYLDVIGSEGLKGSTTITNKIEIKTDSYEKETTNNYAIWRTHILSKDVDLRIWKYGPNEAAIGQEIEYRIGYYNQGLSIAEDVKISDILPDELEYLNDTSGLSFNRTGNVLSWVIGTMTPWFSNEFRVRVKVKENALASSTITNITEITTTNPDTDYTNNKAITTTHICLPNPELKIRKWQSNGEVTAGQRMNYYIRYSNEGKGSAANVKLTDILPIGVTYVSDNSGIAPIISGNICIWDVGTVTPNTSKDFILTVEVNKYIQASTTLTNVIEITTTNHQTSDKYTCTTHVLEPIADVLIYKFGPDKAIYGGKFTYEITYNNNSTTDADGVVIKDILDPQLIYLSDTLGITATVTGNKISWYIGTMSTWASGHFLLRVMVPYSVPASTTLTNVVEITTTTKEDKYNNNRATATTHVDMPNVDVGIEKKGDDARPGFNKTYHITYYNNGTEQAEDVVIIDKLPPEVQYLSSSAGGSYNNASHTVTWNIGSLLPQTTRYMTIEVKIPISQASGVNLYNYIEIITASPEYDYTNNKYTEIETVVTSIDPNDKLVSPQRYIRDNELLNYTIRFENQATATASAILITIEDQLSSNLDWTTMKFSQIKIGTRSYTLENFDRGSLSCSYDVGSGTIRWVFDFKTGEQGLPPNVSPPEGEGYVSFSINARQGLSAGTEISNIATIRFDYNEPMETPAVTNIVDLDKPTSTVLSLAPYQTATSFAVYWSGTDTAGNKSGEIENYTVYASDNNGTFTKWLEETPETSGTFTGRTGHSYSFYCLATDRAKNSEAKTSGTEAFTSLTLLKHFVISTLTTTEIYHGGTLPLTLSIYDSEGQLITDYIGTATLRDKLGVVGTAVFEGTSTWSGNTIILQTPSGGTDTIIAEAQGVISAISETFMILIDRNVGGTVTLWTSGVGTTTIGFGTSTIFDKTGGLLLDFYITIDCILPDGIAMPEGGTIQSLRSIYAYDRNHSSLKGTFTPIAYLEIPYSDADQDGFVDGTKIKETTLLLYVWENDHWKEIEGCGVDKDRNIVYCNINYLTTFMPIGFLLAPSILGNVAVYPNPFKPNSGLGHEYITFGSKQGINRRLTEYATIKIYTISGDLVKTLDVTPQDDGQKVWYGDNDSGKRIASGVYIYLITNPQGEKCIGKLAIIR